MLDPGLDPVDLAGFLPCTVIRVKVDLPEPFARIQLTPDDPGVPGFEIPISLDQARQLALILAKERAPRPMTAELMTDVMTFNGLSVAYVALTSIENGNFLAQLAVASPDGKVSVFAARPSDAIMLALLQPVVAPVIVNPDLLPVPENIASRDANESNSKGA